MSSWIDWSCGGVRHAGEAIECCSCGGSIGKILEEFQGHWICGDCLEFVEFDCGKDEE